MDKYAAVFIINTVHVRRPSENNKSKAKAQASYQSINPMTDRERNRHWADPL